MTGEGDVKEVQMDAPPEGRTSRKRRSGHKKSRKTHDAHDGTVVTKDAAAVSAPAPAAASGPATAVGARASAPKVIIAPAKKKPAKVLLVPKGATVTRTVPRKTFKAKRVKVIIDNTAKTQKHRNSVLTKVDEMTDDQIRAAAVHARLSRRERVGAAPIGLLRQMVKDYQTMKGQLL
jgi:hypothetical protein